MHFTRRDILKLAAASPVLGLITQVGCGDGDCDVRAGDGFPTFMYSGEPGPENLFQHGVASGDPLPDAVILWTRVTPCRGRAPVEVFWEMATRRRVRAARRRRTGRRPTRSATSP